MSDELESWAEAGVDRKFLQMLRDISSFALILRIPPIDVPTTGPFADRLVNSLYESLASVVTDAGFHHVDEIEPFRDADGLGMRYGDDEFEFRVAVEQGKIVLSRPGSRLETFIDWYQRVMPVADNIVSTARSVLQEDHGVPVGIIRGSYSFRFLLHSLTDADGISVRNSKVMQSLLHRYPGPDGAIVAFQERDEPGSDSDEEDIGRVDFKFSRWHGLGDARRSWWYSVEAPGNKRWSTLWFSFEYQGSSHTAPDGTRFGFSAEDFLTEWDLALFHFIRDTAVSGFMQSLMNGYNFETATMSIP